MVTKIFNALDNQKFTLIADIGGTNARFGLVGEDGNIYKEIGLLTKDYATFADAALHYFSLVHEKPENGVIAWAGPVPEGADTVRMTNGGHWKFSIRETARQLGLNELHVMNDYVPQAYAAFSFKKGDYFQVSGGPVHEDGKDVKITILGPGTGLGAINAARTGGRITCTPTEGGHASMPFTSLEDARILDVLQKKGLPVTAEQCVSGTGILNLYEALCTLNGQEPDKKTPGEITAAAQNGECATCAKALELFYYFLGVIAGNQVLITGANRLYIGGGIVPQLGEEAFRNSRFQEGFLGKRKSSHVGLLEQTQVCVVTHPDSGRFGLLEYIKSLQQKDQREQPLSIVKKRRGSLSR
jgi:glucokinase